MQKHSAKSNDIKQFRISSQQKHKQKKLPSTKTQKTSLNQKKKFESSKMIRNAFFSTTRPLRRQTTRLLRQAARPLTQAVTTHSRSFTLAARQEALEEHRKTAEEMFCFQCGQTEAGISCENIGVCGKTPTVSKFQELLQDSLKGLGQYAHRMRVNGVVDHEIDEFMIQGFTTCLTNVNFDPLKLQWFLKESERMIHKAKELYEKSCADKGVEPEQLTGPCEFVYADSLEELEEMGDAVGVLRRSLGKDPDNFSVLEMTMYGIKGMIAMLDQVVTADKFEDCANVCALTFEVLDSLTQDLDIEKRLEMAMKVGIANIECMDLLDKAYTDRFGHPVPTTVHTRPVPGKCILVSGHEIEDLRTVLEQTEGTGINVYSHGEILPGHGYPECNKFPHLKGHIGLSWPNQNFDFKYFPGPILVTTDCMVPPKKSYKNRIFTSRVMGFPGVEHLEAGEWGKLIEKAHECEGYTQEDCEAEPDKELLVGLGWKTVLGMGDKVVKEIQDGNIKNVVYIGGCDSYESERSYFRDVATNLPEDAVIVTTGCGKFRFNDVDFGDINGIPRLIDVGQCNDTWGALKIGLGLADALKMDVHDLPLSFCISWMGQKAVAILLSMLHLNFQNMVLGPKVPAFLTQNVLDVLVDHYKIRRTHTEDYQVDIDNLLGKWEEAPKVQATNP